MYDVAITILTYYADLLTRPQEQTIHPACRYTGSKPIDKARGPWTFLYTRSSCKERSRKVSIIN